MDGWKSEMRLNFVLPLTDTFAAALLSLKVSVTNSDEKKSARNVTEVVNVHRPFQSSQHQSTKSGISASFHKQPSFVNRKMIPVVLVRSPLGSREEEVARWRRRNYSRVDSSTPNGSKLQVAF
jgi:hypothetical protein